MILSFFFFENKGRGIICLSRNIYSFMFFAVLSNSIIEHERRQGGLCPPRISYMVLIK